MPILLVEDERDLAQLWCEYLTAKGHPTEVRHDLAAAREALSSAPYELLIVDYALPDGTAADVVAHLAEVPGPRPHVVVCSGHGNDLPPALLSADVQVLGKPFRLEELEATIRSLRSTRPTVSDER